MRRTLVGWSIALITTMGIATGSQLTLQSYPPREVDVNMLFVPPNQIVKGGASGFDNIIADSLWLTLLQYYGERYFAEDTTMKNLSEMFALITDLDPHFWFAYWLGGWALGENGQTTAAIALLNKGEAANPTEVNYPYLEGFIRFLYMGDYVGSAQAFERASTKPVAEWPEQHRFTRTMAARMYQKQGKDALALTIWKNLEKNASDAALRAIAKKNVTRIEAEMQGKQKPAFPAGKPEPGQPR